MTQFLGMGLIVLGVAVLPLLGIGGMQLLRRKYRPQADKIAPRVGGQLGGVSTRSCRPFVFRYSCSVGWIALRP